MLELSDIQSSQKSDDAAQYFGAGRAIVKRILNRLA
jgi:hypothetical protein